MSSWLDRAVYRIKSHFPWIYPAMDRANGAVTRLLFGSRIRRVLKQVRLDGTILDKPAHIRSIDRADLDRLDAMIADMPDTHLQYFHPHGMDRTSLERVLSSHSVLTFGVFVEDQLVAYAILKLFVTKKAYLGRLVRPSMAGIGLGKLLARYLYWIGYHLDFRVRGTMNPNNAASQHSHQAIRPYTIIASLPTGYDLIEFEVSDADADPPTLFIPPRPPVSHGEPAGSEPHS